MTLAGRYRVEDELGRGGMAKVYRGEDAVLGRAVAVKILAPQYADDPNFVTRFRREAQAAARLSDQHVVSVFDTGSDDGIHFIVMEFVDGRTLADFISGGGRIMPERAVDIAIDVCRALEAAHAQGVIHRDIKPGNIMITPSGDVKVTDFGIARVASNETVAQTAAVLGTASYLSPEQAQSQPVDGRTDIYSLGCVLYEMVTGRPPFLGDSAVAVASKQVLEQPVPPSRLNRDVSPDLDAVILRALAKNPDNRYQSAEEFRRDLERVRRGLPVEATPLLPAAAVGTTRVIQQDVAPAQRTAILEPEPVVEERSRWWIPVIVVLVILAILGVFLWILAHTLLNTDDNGNGNGNGNGNAAQVVVPDLNGQTVGDARSTLQQKGLNLVIGDRVPPTDPTQVPGTITSQDPAANIKVDKGSDVTVTIVGQPAQIEVPQLPDNSTVEQASALLTNAGLTPGDTRQASSDTVPADQVIAFDPPSGTSVDPQTPVAIVVSSGPSQVTVPDVTCRSFSSAANILSHDGLTPSESPTTVGTNPTCPRGDKVASQDPAAGQVVDPGTTVTLFHGSEGQPTGPTATGPSA